MSLVWGAACAGHFNVQPSFRTADLDQKLSTLVRESEYYGGQRSTLNLLKQSSGV